MEDDAGNEYVVSGTAALSLAVGTEYEIIYFGSLSISVNGAAAVTAGLAMSYAFLVTSSDPVTLSVIAIGSVNGETVDESFDVTFSCLLL